MSQSESTVSFHVNNWREQREPLPAIAIILGAIIAFLSLLISAGIPTIILDYLQGFQATIGVFGLAMLITITMEVIELYTISKL